MPPHIILVEDDENVAVMLSRQLQRAGYRVSTAGTIAAGRALIDAPWDLAILDRNLSDGDGVDLCREMRAAVPHACNFGDEGSRSSHSARGSMQVMRQSSFSSTSTSAAATCPAPKTTMFHRVTLKISK
ncbi:MAG: response regulator [Thermoanaerobaculia bacterium]